MSWVEEHIWRGRGLAGHDDDSIAEYVERVRIYQGRTVNSISHHSCDWKTIKERGVCQTRQTRQTRLTASWIPCSKVYRNSKRKNDGSLSCLVFWLAVPVLDSDLKCLVRKCLLNFLNKYQMKNYNSMSYWYSNSNGRFE